MVTLASLAAAFRAARTIILPIQALESTAKALRRHERLRVAPTGLPEFDHAFEVFDKTSTTLIAHEQALQQQADMLRLSHDAIVVWQFDGAIESWNRGAEMLYGFTENEARGRVTHELLRTVFPMPWSDIAAQLQQAGRWEGELRHAVKDGREVTVSARLQLLPGNDGIVRVLEINRDITDRRRSEAALAESEQRVRRKLENVLSPEGDVGDLELADLIDIPALQKMMEDFHAVAGITMAILDLEGRVLVGVGWQDICTRFHRVNATTCRHCLESDTQLSSGLGPGEHRLYKCKNNMWDMATPIFVGGRHVGNVFTGQFFFDDEPVHREFFRAQARQYGFDEGEYLASLDRVPRFDRASIELGMAFLVQLANTLSGLGHSNLKLARLLAERDRLTASLQGSENQLRTLADVLQSEAAALARLNEASSRLWAIRDLRTGLNEVLDAAIDLLGADMGTVRLSDAKREVLEIAAHRGFTQDHFGLLGEISADGDTAVARAMRSRQRVVIEDVDADSAYASCLPAAREADFRAVQSTPLLGRDGAPLGVISTFSRSVHRPSEEELRRFDLYARQAADFIERCRTDEALRRAEEERQTLQTELFHAGRLSEIGRMAAAFAHELNQPLTAVSTYLGGCRRILATDINDEGRKRKLREVIGAGQRPGAARRRDHPRAS